MAIITWTPQDLPAAAALTLTPNGSLSAADTYRWLNDGRTCLVCRKTGAGACTVTAVTPATVGGGLAVADLAFSVPATTGYVVSPFFRPDLYNDANNYVSVTFSEITGLDVAVVRVT